MDARGRRMVAAMESLDAKGMRPTEVGYLLGHGQPWGTSVRSGDYTFTDEELERVEGFDRSTTGPEDVDALILLAVTREGVRMPRVPARVARDIIAHMRSCGVSMKDIASWLGMSAATMYNLRKVSGDRIRLSTFERVVRGWKEWQEAGRPHAGRE